MKYAIPGPDADAQHDSSGQTAKFFGSRNHGHYHGYVLIEYTIMCNGLSTLSLSRLMKQ